MAPSAGWYDDPRDAGRLRFWDGEAWTEHVAPKQSDEPEQPQWRYGTPSWESRPFGQPTRTPTQPSRPGPRQPPRPAPRLTPDGHLLASWGRRFVARLLDLILMSIVGLPATGYFLYRYLEAYENQVGGVDHPKLVVPDAAAVHWYLLALLIQLLILFCYEVLCLRRFGSTIGKRLVDVSVRPLAQGGPLAWNAAVRRGVVIYGLCMLTPVGTIGTIALLVLLVDVLFPLWDPRRQCLHDKVASTVVVHGPRDVVASAP